MVSEGKAKGMGQEWAGPRFGTILQNATMRACNS